MSEKPVENPVEGNEYEIRTSKYGPIRVRFDAAVEVVNAKPTPIPGGLIEGICLPPPAHDKYTVTALDGPFKEKQFTILPTQMFPISSK